MFILFLFCNRVLNAAKLGHFTDPVSALKNKTLLGIKHGVLLWLFKIPKDKVAKFASVVVVNYSEQY